MNTIIRDLIVLGMEEELKFDVDDLMEAELRDFHMRIANIPSEEILDFKNWIYIYKSLNYDIFEGLNIMDVYRFGKYIAAVELSYNGIKEYDILNYIEDGTVLVYNIKFNEDNNPIIRQNTIRRLLIPTDVDEALAFASRFIDADDVESITHILSNILYEPDKYRADVETLKQLGINIKERVKPNKEAEPHNNENTSVNKETKEEFDIYAFIYENIVIGREDVAKEAIRHTIYKDVENITVRDMMVEQYIQYVKNSLI